MTELAFALSFGFATGLFAIGVGNAWVWCRSAFQGGSGLGLASVASTGERALRNSRATTAPSAECNEHRGASHDLFLCPNSGLKAGSENFEMTVFRGPQHGEWFSSRPARANGALTTVTSARLERIGARLAQTRNVYYQTPGRRLGSDAP